MQAGVFAVQDFLRQILLRLRNLKGLDIVGAEYQAREKVYGEAIAIGILQEQKLTYNERHSLTLTKFDGKAIMI